MDAIVSAVRAAGVDRRDLRTALVSLDAIRDYATESAPRVTGYQLQNVVEATIRTIDGTGAVIDAALGAGATSLDGITFRLDAPDAAAAEARRLAVADARLRAETLAAEAGVQVGAVVGIVEGTAPGIPGPPRPAVMFAEKIRSDVATPVEAGTTEIAVDVTVEFSIA